MLELNLNHYRAAVRFGQPITITATACAAIVALIEERDQLRIEVAELEQSRELDCADYDGFRQLDHALYTVAEAEIRRLREALAQIAETREDRAPELARAALEGTPPPPESSTRPEAFLANSEMEKENT